jgi:hypothetical protein
MALDKDILGLALHNARKVFCDKTMDELINEYGSLDEVRKAQASADADEIIKHFKTYAEGKYQAATLTAGGNAVTSVGVNPAVKLF